MLSSTVAEPPKRSLQSPQTRRHPRIRRIRPPLGMHGRDLQPVRQLRNLDAILPPNRDRSPRHGFRPDPQDAGLVTRCWVRGCEVGG